jgi:hypothetical protein
VQVEDVFARAVELSHALDSCYDDDGDIGDDDIGDFADPPGFYMSPNISAAPSLTSSRASSATSSSSSSSSITKAAATAAAVVAPDFSCVSSLSVHCSGLVPLRSHVVQLALHALLHRRMCNLVCLSLRLVPTSLVLPELQDSLSCLSCLQHLTLQFEQCSSDGSASIMRSIARLPLLRSMQLQGLDLSGLLMNAARFSMASPIASLTLRDTPPPHVAATASGDGGVGGAAAAMPLSHIALVVSSCASTLQSLFVSGKQNDPREHRQGGWRLFLHATAHCALLNVLNVSKSGIDAVGCVGLACCLQRLPLLRQLDVCGNPLAAARATPGTEDLVVVGAGVRMLAHALEGLTGLTSLGIRKCCVNRCGAVALLQALHAHTSLTHLAIGGNQYSGLPHPVQELVVIAEGVARMTCAPSSATEYDAVQGYAQAIHAVYAAGDSQEIAVAALRAALAPVNMSALAPQLLQPSMHHPPPMLPQQLLRVICSNSALTSLHLADLCLPIDALPLLASAWQQHTIPLVAFGDFRCRLEGSAGQARQVVDAWATVKQAAIASYARRGRRLPPTLRWPSFQGASTLEEPGK